MKGLWLENQQLTLRDDIPIPVLTNKNEDALIQILCAGICNTDIELLHGYYPYNGILGHELVGVAIDGPSEYINQRVVGEINISCGLCNYCNGTLSNIVSKNHCTTRTVLGIVNHHGAFGNYIILPICNLYIVPNHISNEIATFTEPVAAALEIQKQITILPEHKVCVIGDGKLGQLVAQTIDALTKCQLIVIGKHPEKLINLSKRGIQTYCITSNDNTTGSDNNNNNENDILKEHSYDICIECTGNENGFHLATSLVRPRGTLILKSTYANKISIDISNIVVNEITIIGSRCGPFDKALELLATNQIDVTSLIHATYKFDNALKAFEHAQIKGAQKILLDMT